MHFQLQNSAWTQVTCNLYSKLQSATHLTFWLLFDYTQGLFIPRCRVSAVLGMQACVQSMHLPTPTPPPGDYSETA